MRTRKNAPGSEQSWVAEGETTQQDVEQGLPFLPFEVMTLGLSEMSAIFRKKPETIAKQLREKPETLPPQLDLPAQKEPLWLATVVAQWLRQRSSSTSTSKPSADLLSTERTSSSPDVTEWLRQQSKLPPVPDLHNDSERE